MRFRGRILQRHLKHSKGLENFQIDNSSKDNLPAQVFTFKSGEEWYSHEEECYSHDEE